MNAFRLLGIAECHHLSSSVLLLARQIWWTDLASNDGLIVPRRSSPLTVYITWQMSSIKTEGKNIIYFYNLCYFCQRCLYIILMASFFLSFTNQGAEYSTVYCYRSVNNYRLLRRLPYIRVFSRVTKFAKMGKIRYILNLC